MFRTCSVAAIAAAMITPIVPAQQLLFERAGLSPSDYQGAAVGLGDLDGDGVVDFAIGGTGEDGGGTDAGAIHVLSGRTFAELAVLYGETPGDAFAISRRIPDVDGDGMDDFLASAYRADYGGVDTGSIYVYSGRTLALIQRLDGSPSSPYFHRGGGLGDVDGDGRGDVFVADQLAGNGFGNVYVYSSATWTPLYTLVGSDPDSAFAGSAAAVGDVDQDGIADLLVGAYHADGPGGTEWNGAAFLYSGRSGTLLRTYQGVQQYDELGEECVDLGDVNSDGVHDHLILSRHGGDGFGDLGDSAAAHVYSGKDGALLTTIAPPNGGPFYLSWTNAGAPGDVTGDGVPDFVLGATYYDEINQVGHSAALVHSGRTLQRVHAIIRNARVPSYEPSFAPLGDLDGDGLDDLSLAYLTRDSAGLARIYGGSALWLKLNTFDVTVGDTVHLSALEGVPGNLAALALVDVDGIPTFQLVGGLGTFDATGVWLVSGTVPSGLSNVSLGFQAFGFDAAGRLLRSARDHLDIH